MAGTLLKKDGTEIDGTAVGDPEVGAVVAPGAPETGTPVVVGDPNVGTSVPSTGVGAKVEGTLSSTKSLSGDFSPSTS